MPQGEQVKNGKSFEYAIAIAYFQHIQQIGKPVELVENSALNVARGFFNGNDLNTQNKYIQAASSTIDTMVRIEPSLVNTTNDDDILKISLNNDSSGEYGDVRDIIFNKISPTWEIGFSAKNNNDAVKHSRLSKTLDFGNVWLNIPCSSSYWNNITPIFDYLSNKIGQTWESLGSDKQKMVYVPLLNAFKEELLKINLHNDNVPQNLIRYLIGKYPFYKIIKDDAHNLVIVKAFNIEGHLQKSRAGVKTLYKTPSINLPTRIVEFEFKQNSMDTLNMIMDGGWEISFRIHNADKMIETSLKFDIRLLGNPPILFTQHLFQDLPCTK